MSTQADRDAFYAHLDVCRRCRENTFNLCPTGANLLLKKAAVGRAP